MAADHPPAPTRAPTYPLPRTATTNATPEIHILNRTISGSPTQKGLQRSHSHHSHHSHNHHGHGHHTGKIGRLVGRLRSSSDLRRHPRKASTSPPDGHGLINTAFKKRHSPNKSTSSSSTDLRPDAQVSLDLWTDAYDYLRDHPTSAGLVTAYEAVISQELPDHLKLGGMSTTLRDHPEERRSELLSAITTAGLAKRRPPTDNNDDGMDEPRRVVESAKDTIEIMLTAYPSAAVAWSGLCTVAPMLLQALLRQEDLRQGILHVTGRIPWYMYLSQLLLPDSWEDRSTFSAREESMRDALQKLYRKVLEFEMNCVCAAASAWNKPAKNVVDWQGLGGLGRTLGEAEDEVRADVDKYATSAVMKWLSRCDRDLDLSSDGDGDAVPDGERGRVG